MKKLFVLILMFSIISSFAQSDVQKDVILSNYSAGSSANVITEIPFQKGETTGSIYIAEDWYSGSLELIDGRVVANYPLKYNIRNNEIEINTEEGVRIVNYSMIKDFAWMNTTKGVELFQNCDSYTKNNEDLNLTGFFQVLVDGKTKLFIKSKIDLVESNYNVAMNAGSKSDKFVKKDEYYIYKDEQLHKILKSKGSVLNVLKDKKKEVKNYAKNNDLKFRVIEDLVKIIEYYNTLS